MKEETSRKAILSVYWKDFYIDATLIGDFPEIIEFSSIESIDSLQLLDIIRRIDKHAELLIIVNRSEYKKGWSNFVDSVYLINQEICIRKISAKREVNDSNKLLDFFTREMMYAEHEGDMIVPIAE